MPKAPGKFLLLLMLCALAEPVAAQYGAITIPGNLAQLTGRAAVIVRGTVTSARVEKHPVYRGLNTVVVSLHVSDRLKGRVGANYTFRQYLWDLRAQNAAGGYRKGQELLLFLIAPNADGLSSPAGQDQGKFRIQRDRDGRELAVNGHGNRKLFDGVAENSQKEGVALSAQSRSLLASGTAGPIDAQALSALVRELVAAER